MNKAQHNTTAKTVAKHIATLGPIGFLKAPGTWATAATLPLVYLVSQLHMSMTEHVWLLIFLGTLVVWCVAMAWRQFDGEDSPHIVLDEVLGCVVTFVGIPLSVPLLVIGFLYFRFFDIVKPFGIKYLQKIPGSWGIVLDDVAAGLATNIVLRLWFSEGWWQLLRKKFLFGILT